MATTSPSLPFMSVGSITEGLASRNSAQTGDFNGDGFTDFCLPQFAEIVDEEGNVVGVRSWIIVAFGDGSGSIDHELGERGFLEIDGLPPGSTACADLNEDGITDIVGIASSPDREPNEPLMCRVWLGDRSAALEPIDVAELDRAPYSPLVFDADLDGTLDLTLISLTAEGSLEILTLLGDGAGRFQQPIVFPVPELLLPAAGTLRVGDIDGDGIHDILFVAASPQLVGQFQLVVSYGGEEVGLYDVRVGGGLPFFPQQTAIGDIDGDGYDDILAVHWIDLGIGDEGNVVPSESELSTSFSIAYGTPARVAEVAETHDLGTALKSARIEDLDDDGFGDVVLITDRAIAIVLEGASAGLQLPSSAYSAANGSHSRCVLGGVDDINGDGIQDLYMQLYEQEIVVRFGDGAGGFGTSWMAPPITTDLPVYATSLAGPADFDNDGNQDLVFLEGLGLGIAYGDGLGGFDEMVVLADESGWSAACVGDYDGDGRADLAIGQEFLSQDQSLRLFMNRGERDFQQAPVGIDSSRRVSELIAGDLNGDALDDLIVCEADRTYVLIAHPEAGFDLGPSIWLEPERLSDAIVARGGIALYKPQLLDVNSDGKLDLIAVDALATHTRTIVWLGDGSGGFIDIAEYPYRRLHGWPSDLNDDGYPDLMALGVDPEYVVLYGSSTGELLPSIVDVAPWMGVGAEMVGDLDNDGRVDFAEAWGSVLWIYLGQGFGLRGERLQFAPNAFGSFSYDISTLAGDFDGDGSLDIALAAQQQISVILNRFTRIGESE